MSGVEIALAGAPFVVPVAIPVSGVERDWQAWRHRLDAGHWALRMPVTCAVLAAAAEIAGCHARAVWGLAPGVLAWRERDTGRRGWRALMTGAEAALIDALEGAGLARFEDAEGAGDGG